MDEAIAEDMVDILAKHSFLKPGRRLRALLNTLGNSGNVKVRTFQDMTEGKFMTADQEKKVKKLKFKPNFSEDMIDEVLGENELDDE